MKKILFAVATFALVPAGAQAQLLGGGGLGGALGGSIGGTLGGTLGGGLERPVGGTVDRTSRTVRGAVDASGSTDGTQSVDARRGTVSAERSANGSIMASTASLADVVVPPASRMAQAGGSGEASGQGSASAQLIGTDAATGALTGTAAPIVQGARAGSAAAVSSVRGAAMPGEAMVAGSGGGSVTGSLFASPLAAAGSAAAAGEGVATVSRGMLVLLADGSSLGKVKQIVANGRGEVEQVVVKQGKITRALPASMFSASGDALVLTQASGAASPQDTGESAE